MNAVCAGATQNEVRIWASDWAGTQLPRVAVSDAGGNAVPSPPSWHALPTPPGANNRYGVFTLGQLVPGAAYSVTLRDVTGEQIMLNTRTLPAQLPSQGISLLLCSCYYEGDDDGELAATLKDLPAEERPALKLLVGDQVYTDVPGFGLFAGSGVKEYTERYEQYWNDVHYQEFLRHGPNFFTCDDHEWWNNSPEHQFWLSRSNDANWQNTLAAGKQVYATYQVQPNQHGGFWQQVQIGSVGIFLADTRSERKRRSQDDRRVMSAPQRAALQAWAANLAGPGFLVLGQPLFGSRGDWKDWNLPDYPDDYRLFWDLLETSAHDIVILTGDIHTGRLAFSPLANGLAARPRILEFTASPMALVPPWPLWTKEPGVPDEIEVPAGHSKRRVELRFGTGVRNFGIIRLRPAAMGGVDAQFSLWDLKRRRLAKWGDGVCQSNASEFILH